MPQPVQLSIRIDDEGVQVLEQTEDKLDDVGNKAKRTTSKMRQGFERVHRSMKRVQGAVFSLRGGIVALLAVMTTGALVQFGRNLIAPSRQVERMTVGFKVLTGSTKVAKARLAELMEFARTTPFELPEVFQAARLMRVFGIDTNANMRLLGDAASAAQVPIQELAVWFGRLSSGDFGEALMRFRELGVATRKDFEGQGLEFDRNGSLRATASQAMNALGRIVRGKFGGMMAEQAKTMDGMISNFQDFVFRAKLKLGEPLFRMVKGSLQKILDQSTKIAESGKLEEWGEKIADAAGNALLWFGHVVDFMRNSVIPAIRDAWDWLKKLPDAVREFDIGDFGEKLGSHIAEGFKKAFSVSSILLGGSAGASGQGPAMIGDRKPTLNFTPSQLEAMGGLTQDEAMEATSKGLDRSDLAGAIEKLLVDRASGGGGGGGGGADTSEGQREFVSRGTAVADFRLGGQTAGEAPALGAPAPAGAGSVGGGDIQEAQAARPDIGSTEALQAGVEASRELYQQMVQDALDNLSLVQEAWLDFKEANVDLVGDWIEGLADTTMTGAERWQRILDGMKQNALNMISDLVTGWLKARIRQATGEKIVQKEMAATAGVAQATAASESAASAQVTAAKSAEATSKVWSGVAPLLLFGIPIALAMFAAMQSNSVKFALGGMVTHGSGAKDDAPALLTRGEGVLSQRGMRALDRLNAGELPSSGPMIGELTIHADGGTTREDLEAVVEDTLIPTLEDLLEQNRLNISGSELQST